METKRKRGKNITQAVFNNCINTMTDEGITPTVTGIVERIGGSYTTISTFFDEWKKQQKASSDTVIGVPLFVMEAAEQIGIKWWAAVQQDVVEQIDKAKKDTDTRIEAFANERNEFLVSTDKYKQAFEDELQAREQLARSHEKELIKYQQAIAQHETVLAVQTEKSAQQGETIKECKLTIQKLEAKLKASQQATQKQITLFSESTISHKHDIENIRADHKSQLAELMKNTAESTKLTEKYEANLNALLEQKDKLLAEKEAQNSKLTSDAVIQTDKITSLEQQLKQAVAKLTKEKTKEDV